MRARGTGRQPVATTMAFVRLLKSLMRDPEIGHRFVPIIPIDGFHSGHRSKSIRIAHTTAAVASMGTVVRKTAMRQRGAWSRARRQRRRDPSQSQASPSNTSRYSAAGK